VKGWLELCHRDGSLPSVMHLQKDPDLEYCTSQTWFSKFLSEPNRHHENTKPDSATNVNKLHNQNGLSELHPPADTQKIPKSEPTDFAPLDIRVETVEHIKTVENPRDNREINQPIKYTDDPDLNNAITYDEDLNKLQASLMREGFSMSTVIGMVLEVGKSKKQVEINNTKNEENRERLNYRMKLCGLKEKSFIPGDGNCQFSSVSDQLFNTIDRADYVRKSAVDWLRKNKNWKLANGAVMSDFAHDQTWEEFCNDLSRHGIWGNHLTLVAISEHFGNRICIVSSVESDSFMISISPPVLRSPKLILLSHYAEYHYGSIETTPGYNNILLQ